MMTGAPLAGRTSPEARAAVLAVPVGSLEQHGPHLPLDTDARIAEAVCAAVADRCPDVVVAPCVAYGSSGEHEGFAGTVSIGRDALRLLLIELARSATRWADRIVFVSGHGGNVPSLVTATRLLRTEGRDVSWTTCGEPGFDAHAGRSETSLLLAIAPGQVRRDRLEPGVRTPVDQLWARLLAEGVAGVSANGVLGDPRGSSASEGAALLEQLAARVSAQITHPRVTEDGALARPSAAVPA